MGARSTLSALSPQVEKQQEQLEQLTAENGELEKRLEEDEVAGDGSGEDSGSSKKDSYAISRQRRPRKRRRSPLRSESKLVSKRNRVLLPL